MVCSVANHLNDIAKTNPELVLATLTKWRSKKISKTKSNDELDYLIRHSLRTLVKQGHKNTMNFLGYTKPMMELNHFSLSPTSLKLSELKVSGIRLEFSGNIISHAQQKLIIDYRICFSGKNPTSPPREKVFKLTTLLTNKGKNT